VSLTWHSHFTGSFATALASSFEISRASFRRATSRRSLNSMLELLRDKETGTSRATADRPSSPSTFSVEWRCSVDHIDFKPGSDFNLTGPRTKVPARLRTDELAAAKPIFDPGPLRRTTMPLCKPFNIAHGKRITSVTNFLCRSGLELEHLPPASATKPLAPEVVGPPQPALPSDLSRCDSPRFKTCACSVKYAQDPQATHSAGSVAVRQAGCVLV
jgi:hypothetical protein